MQRAMPLLDRLEVDFGIDLIVPARNTAGGLVEIILGQFVDLFGAFHACLDGVVQVGGGDAFWTGDWLAHDDSFKIVAVELGRMQGAPALSRRATPSLIEGCCDLA